MAPDSLPGSGADWAMNALRRCSDRLERLPPRAVAAFLTILGLLLVLQWLAFVWWMGVNAPFSDQWALLTLLFNGFQWSDVAAAFFWQHGPHRQGLPFSLVLPMYHWSDWNVRIDSFWIAVVQLVAGALVLRLRRVLLPEPWRLWDAVLLLTFWGLTTFETVVVAPNASHSLFPLLLLVLFLNVWLSAAGGLRTASLALLIGCLGFTGFGLTALPVLVLVLILALWRGPVEQRRTALVLLGVCALTFGAFLQNYRFVVAADGFEVMRTNPLDYLHYLVAMLGHFVTIFQWGNASTLSGYLFLAALLVVGGWGLMRLIQAPASHTDAAPGGQRFWQVVVILVGSSLTFAALTSYGRAQLGLGSAAASRYTALLLPAFAALYLVLFQQRRTSLAVQGALVLLTLACLVRVLPESAWAIHGARYAAGLKLCWLAQRQLSGQVDEADRRVMALDDRHQFQPGWMGRADQWAFLERHRLGPMAPHAQPAPLLSIYPDACQLLREQAH